MPHPMAFKTAPTTVVSAQTSLVPRWVTARSPDAFRVLYKPPSTVFPCRPSFCPPAPWGPSAPAEPAVQSHVPACVHLGFRLLSAPVACLCGLRPDQPPCLQGDLVFVVGKLDGLMVVGVRRHNADDIVATALAVEPMKFVYRGR